MGSFAPLVHQINLDDQVDLDQKVVNKELFLYWRHSAVLNSVGAIPGQPLTGEADGPTTQGPSWGYLKVNSSETLSIFDDKCPQNGSKNELMVPRTTMGCPHEGPRVGKPTELLGFGVWGVGFGVGCILSKST